EQALAVQREVRNASQHVYVDLTMQVLRDAVAVQLNSTPRVVGSVTAWIDSLDLPEEESSAGHRCSAGPPRLRSSLSQPGPPRSAFPR
ncbi:MAG: hypothetical protein ACYCX7_06120, partial [Solirubrobacteraceae bacterium]